MNRNQVLAVLHHSKPMLASRYGVRRLALFGSTARDDSDVDVLVVFDGVASAARYFGIQLHLEDALGWLLGGPGIREGAAAGAASFHRKRSGLCLS
ncbi:nucleotidyltransferase domain-containing protein [uncultured Nitrosomonas sp.]|uniref:nucleotidyltransferase family protein n=1 Tax=uncultured Nitrosomonas sp. TaxID=156424 RepID=UPI00263185FD|nr:nucleotidyltransferase domain-containing protein [uncultured Nitrosomonas sp.]